jgi:hypothetical protein
MSLNAEDRPINRRDVWLGIAAGIILGCAVTGGAAAVLLAGVSGCP